MNSSKLIQPFVDGLFSTYVETRQHLLVLVLFKNIGLFQG